MSMSFSSNVNTGPAYQSSDKCIESKLFNFGDADVVFRSCDNVLFKIHRKNLETSTGCFAPPEFSTNDEIVPLTESSSTLELLFQYIYPMPQPDIALLPIEEQTEVAEAAEKYQVYPAIYVCKMTIGMALRNNPLSVFTYAGRHGHQDLLVKAAPHLIGTPLNKVVSAIPGYLVVPWMNYYSMWEGQLREARLYNTNGRCANLSIGHHFDVIKCIAQLEDAKALNNLDGVFGELNTGDRSSFQIYLRGWRTQIENNMRRMKTFDAFL